MYMFMTVYIDDQHRKGIKKNTYLSPPNTTAALKPVYFPSCVK